MCSSDLDNIARLLGIGRDAVANRTRVVVMPYLSGERLPDYPYARGSIVGIDHATSAGEVLLAAYEGVAYSLVRSLDLVEVHSSGIDPDAAIVLIGGGARSTAWQDAIGRLSGRALLVPDLDELVAWGAAAQAAGVLCREPGIAIARRWNIARGPTIPARTIDREAIDRIDRVRTAAHELNARELFAIRPVVQGEAA